MRAAIITGPEKTEIVEVQTPTAGPDDVLVRIRACGICGSDTLYISIGGLPPRHGCMPIGHEPAGEVVEVGRGVHGIAVGDRVVVNPMAIADDIIGNGGSAGALAEYLLIKDAVRGQSLEVVPDHIPFEVAALNEPMAVAVHAVNQVAPRQSDQVLVLGAGPIGLGITIALKSRGVKHVVVADILPARLEKALESRCRRGDQLQGRGRHRPIDRAAWARGFDVAEQGRHSTCSWTPPAFRRPSTRRSPVAKRGAKLGVVAVHKEPIGIDFMNLMSNELTIVGSMGYPTEIFEVTKDIIENWEKYPADHQPHFRNFDDLKRHCNVLPLPGAADKVVVTLGSTVKAE